jgi:hypothetical protein
MPDFSNTSDNRKVLLFFNLSKAEFYIFFMPRATYYEDFRADLIGRKGCPQFMQRAQILSSKNNVE